MKKFNIYRYALVLVVAILSTSCLDDLNIRPNDDDLFTNEKFYAKNESYKQFLAKIYGGLALTGQQGPAGNSDLGGLIDEGFSQYLRGYWQLQELTTDEAIIAWNESENRTIKDLNFNQWNADNIFVEAFFARIFFQIGLVNEFLRESTPEKLASRGQSSLATEVNMYRAEARFLRALSYYHAIDLFGNVPFGTESDNFGTAPSQKSRSFVFNYIISELNAIETLVATPRSNQYGRIDQAAVWMLQAKLYQNAAVYTGTDRSAEALVAVNKVINSGYTIANVADYSDLFKADNHTNGAESEVIFPIRYDGVLTQSWGGMTYLVHASIDSEQRSIQHLGVDGGWFGYRVRPEFVNSIGGTGDNRVMTLPGNADPSQINDYLVFAQGTKLVKFSNLNSDGTNSVSLSQCSADFPLFRLADAYLMYAELAVVNGKGDIGQALSYVNELRTRAGVINVAAGDLTPDFILNERGRELYWEGHRRQDLIRFNKYTTGYTWSWKGGSAVGTDLNDKYKLFPIPTSELRVNKNLAQNPGY